MTTEMILNEINVVRLKQPAIAEILAMIILRGEMDTLDWKQVNQAFKDRWSTSARERVLTMVWKIVEKANVQHD